MLSTVWLSLAVAMPGRLKSSNGTVSPAASVSFTLQGDEVSSKGGQLSDQSACVYVYIYIYHYIPAGRGVRRRQTSSNMVNLPLFCGTKWT